MGGRGGKGDQNRKRMLAFFSMFHLEIKWPWSKYWEPFGLDQAWGRYTLPSSLSCPSLPRPYDTEQEKTERRRNGHHLATLGNTLTKDSSPIYIPETLKEKDRSPEYPLWRKATSIHKILEYPDNGPTRQGPETLSSMFVGYVSTGVCLTNEWLWASYFWWLNIIY